MLYNLINKKASFQEIIISLFVYSFFLLAIFPIHEWAHAFAAHKLGDDTAKYNGRLTLNPMAHLDPMGAACLLLFGLGWAKPVPVNTLNFRNRKLHMGLTALAGPLSNLIIAFIGMVILKVILILPLNIPLKFLFALLFTLELFVQINITLAVFNLLPVPPLDGSKIAAIFLPDRIYYKLMEYERYVFIVVIILVFSGAFSKIIAEVSLFIMNVFNAILFFL